MSAITGIGDSATIVFSASTSTSRGTATRTRSEPASATSRICFMVAGTFAVSVLVIVCTTTGAPPPTGTSLTQIWRLEATPQGYRGHESAPRPARERIAHRRRGLPLHGHHMPTGDARHDALPVSEPERRGAPPAPPRHGGRPP